jgi:hypothetical protein
MAALVFLVRISVGGAALPFCWRHILFYFFVLSFNSPENQWNGEPKIGIDCGNCNFTGLILNCEIVVCVVNLNLISSK